MTVKSQAAGALQRHQLTLSLNVDDPDLSGFRRTKAIGRACTPISRAVPAGPQAKSCVGQALVWLAILLSVSSAPSSPVCSFRDLVNILVQGSLLKSCCHRRRHFAPSHHEVGQSARALVVAPKKAAAIVGPCGTY
jgi:hypothetical protein